MSPKGNVVIPFSNTYLLSPCQKQSDKNSIVNLRTKQFDPAIVRKKDGTIEVVEIIEYSTTSQSQTIKIIKQKRISKDINLM